MLSGVIGRALFSVVYLSFLPEPLFGGVLPFRDLDKERGQRVATDGAAYPSVTPYPPKEVLQPSACILLQGGLIRRID